MTSQLTLAALRAAYYQLINPSDADDPDFTLAVNKGLQRIIESGEWAGTHIEAAFDGSLGYITCPPHVESILGVTMDKVPTPIYSDYHQYCEFGPGTIDASYPTRALLIEVPEDVPSVVDLTAGQVVRFLNVVPADNGVAVRVFGEDTNDNPIFDVNTGYEGIGIVLVTGSQVPMSTPLNRFTAVQKPRTKGRINVYGWDGSTATLLSQYQPNETLPAYRRYLSGTLDSSQPIGCLCKLRHIPIFAETDIVRVGNLAAWEHALMAGKFTTLEQFDKATDRWAECYKLLNREHMSRRGKAKPQFTFSGPLSSQSRVKVN